MYRRSPLVVATLLALAQLAQPLTVRAEPNGTLAVDVKNYASDVKISDKVEKQLEHAGVEWGITDKVLVLSQVSKKFVRADLPHLTRFGSRKELELEPGRYTLTCIGYVHGSNSRDVTKVLSTSAFFNEGVLPFTILPGKTTTLEIFPTMQKQAKTSFLVKVKVFMPDLEVRVNEDGAPGATAVVNARSASSIGWDDYHGPLKY